MIVDDFQNVLGRVESETEAFYHLAIEKGVKDWPKALGIVQQHRSDEAIFFDKVMFPFLPILSHMIAPNGPPNRTAPFAKFFENAVWVYIRRANIYEQTVSKYTAEILGVWDAEMASDGFNDSMEFDIDVARDYLRGFIQEDAQWLEFFRRHRISPIQIYYEDAVPNFPHYLNPIIAAAGLTIDFANLRPRRKQKLGNARSAVLAGVLERMVQRDLIAQLF
jgi:LPS sulfotransferase NodH